MALDMLSNPTIPHVAVEPPLGALVIAKAPQSNAVTSTCYSSSISSDLQLTSRASSMTSSTCCITCSGLPIPGCVGPAGPCAITAALSGASFASNGDSTSASSPAASRRSSSSGGGCMCAASPKGSPPTGGSVLPSCSAEFIMFSWKVVDCPFGDLEHDWTMCPFAHPGEKARRRSPATHPYQAACCPDVRRRGRCPRGSTCQWAHSVFEIHLHPSKFRTKMCRDGAACTRKICFFAHEEKDLRTPLVLDATATAEQKVLQQEAALQHSLHLEHLKQHAVAVQQLLQQQQPPQQPQQEQQHQQHQGSQSPGGSEPQLTLQQLQERVNIWRAVQEAAAQTGFTLLPSPLAPAAAALPQVCSTDAGFLISPQPASPVPSVDAVCDAPLRMPLPLAQRAPGAPCACTTGHDMSAALCQLLQGPGQQGGLAIPGVGCELGCITECTGDCGLLSSIASSPFGSPPPTSSLHGLGWAAAGSVGSPVLGGGGWPLMPNAVPRGAAYPVGPCQQLGGMSPAAIAAGRMGMGFGMGGLPGSGLEGHAW